MDKYELAKLLNAQVRVPIRVTLPSGTDVEVPRVFRKERRRPEKMPAWDALVSGKQLLDLDARAIWSEFIIIRLLERHGWSAVNVIDKKLRLFWTNPGVDAEEIPPNVMTIFDRVAKTADTTRGGAWDVLAWKDDEVLFLESKRLKKDPFKVNQMKWLEAGLGDPAQPFFCVVEYDF